MISDRMVRAAVLGLIGITGCSASEGAPRLALQPCTDLPSLPTARCGTLTAPLDRAHPAAGTTTVAFALVPHSDQSTPARGTLATNPGGPGTSTIDFAGPLYATALAPLLAHWDLLLVDPRGVGRSDPLSCAALADPTRVFTPIDQQRARIGQCGSELGDRARYYGTAAIADDFDDIRAGLDIDALDLLGDSYGTFLMTVYAQRHPEHVRSVVLSGAYAVNDVGDGTVTAQAVERAISLIGQRAGTYDGATAVDDLAVVAAQLRQQPDSLQTDFGGQTYTVPLDEWALAGAVGKLYAGRPDLDGSAALASAVHAARSGDPTGLRAVVSAHLVTSATTLAATAVYSDAANWATSCHDYPRPFRYADDIATRGKAYADYLVAQTSRDFGPFSARAWLTRDTYDSGGCLDWPDDPAAEPPFASGTRLEDLPALVLSGDLDANTPSSSGQAAAAQFPHAQWTEVMNAGHTPSLTSEGQALIMAFIEQAR